MQHQSVTHRLLGHLGRRPLPIIVALLSIVATAGAYEPTSHYSLEDIEGWQVYVHRDLLPGGEHRETGVGALRQLRYGLAKTRQMVADEPLKKLQAVKIWLEVDSTNGKHGRTAAYQYHPHVDWLKKMDFHPDKEKCVEYGTAAGLAKRTDFKTVQVTMHELAHAFHDQVLGFDDADVIAAHERAREEGKYPERDWVVRANHKEFFAGLTTRYFESEERRKEIVERDPVFAKKLEEYFGQPKALFETPLDDAAWNQFRGPGGNGQTNSKRLPLVWSETKGVAWKTAIHGRAWSSPVVFGDQIWMTSATEDGKRLYAICVDAKSGRIVHDITVYEIAEPMFCMPYNSYASPTPVIDKGRVWVHFGSAGTACFDTTTGKVLWSRQDLKCDHFRGPGSSPIPYENLLIVNFDGFDFQYVIALDKQTGKTVWKTDRTIDYGSEDGDMKKAFCTPAVFEHLGRKQLVSPAAVGTVAYDPATGKELWKVYHGGYNAAARPIYSHGMVFITTERGLRLLAVRPDGNGNVTDTHIEWTCDKATPTRPSQLIVGDHFYMVNDKGIASCLDVETGEPTWTERIGGPHSASPIHADGRIYFFDEKDGISRVIEANPKEFKLLAENQLDAGCMASPAVIGDALIVRTKTHLYRIER